VDGPATAVLTPAHLRRFFGVEARIDEAPGQIGLVITPRLPAPAS
jgi:hypothetical protein